MSGDCKQALGLHLDPISQVKEEGWISSPPGSWPALTSSTPVRPRSHRLSTTQPLRATQGLRVSLEAWVPMEEPWQNRQQVQGRPGLVEPLSSHESKGRQGRLSCNSEDTEIIPQRGSPSRQPNAKPQLRLRPEKTAA